MQYLVHSKDPVALTAGLYLQSKGATRLIVDHGITATKDMVVLISSDSPALKQKFIRRLREDNQDILGVTIPEWAVGAREVILINSRRASQQGWLQDTLRQLHSRLTGIPLVPHSKARRRRVRGKPQTGFVRQSEW